MVIPKRHHYLPQFYLDGFSRDGFLWVFDRELKQYRKQTPKNTAVKAHYYTFTDKDGQKDTQVESLLSLIETETKPIIDKIDNRDLITVDEKINLSLFVAFLMTRVPQFEKTTDKLHEKIIKQIAKIVFTDEKRVEAMITELDQDDGESSEVTPEQVIDFIWRDEYELLFDRVQSIGSMLKMSTKIFNLFRQMDWLFVCSPEKTSFITTDDPFTLIPPDDYDPKSFYGVGLITPGTRKVVPLSHKTCLIMFDRGDHMDYWEAPRSQVRIINLNLASSCDRLVIGRDKALVKNLVQKTRI